MKGIFTLLLAIFALAAPRSAVAQEGERWTFDPYGRVEVGFVSAETGTRDDQIVVDGDAATLRTQAGVKIGDDTTEFTLEADRIWVERLGEGRTDSNRDRYTATLDQEIGDDWEVQLRARYYDDLVTAEANDTDEQQAAIRFTYQPERAHRFRLGASWREREYDLIDEDGFDTVDETGSGPRIDAEYRYRMGRYHYLALDLRAEEIDSDADRRRYTRQSAAVAYTRPLNRDLRVRPALQVLHTRFGGRIADDGQPRDDTLIAPEVELLWWPDNWRIEAEAKYIFTSSNDARRDREGYRLTLSVGYVF